MNLKEHLPCSVILFKVEGVLKSFEFRSVKQPAEGTALPVIYAFERTHHHKIECVFSG